MFKKIVQKLAHNMGYEIIPLWKKEKLAMAEHLKSLFKFHRIEYVLDIGGNKGQYYDYLRHHVGYDGHIITFEPLAKNCEILAERERLDDKWRVFPIALGAVDEEKTINIMNYNTFSSFLTPTSSNTSEFDELNRVVAVENVSVKTLDSIWNEIFHGCSNVGVYMKIDTQGYDIEVIKGALNSLQFICAMQVEASVIGIYDGIPPMFELIEYIRKYGYEIAGMSPVSINSQQHVVEFDVVMVRN